MAVLVEQALEPRPLVHVCLSLEVGGLERLIVGLTQFRLGSGNSVQVICLEQPGSLAQIVASSGAVVHALNKRPGVRLSTIRELARLLSSIRPMVVHTHQIAALLHTGPAAWSSGVPVVVHTEHGSHLLTRSGLARKRAAWVWAAAAAWADAIVSVSAEVDAGLAQIARVPPRKRRILANGINPDPVIEPAEITALRAELALPVGTPVIGTVGRLAEIKRQDWLLAAFAAVHSHRPDARLLIVGDGPERERLDNLAGELGIRESVIFAGARSRPEALFRLMNVFALTSRSEGLPLSVLEAWSAGLPVVCTAVGGLPAIVENGVNGFLVPPADIPALAASLTNLLEHPPLSRALGQAGRKLVLQQYSLAQTAIAYDQLYAKLLKRSRG